MQVTPKTEEQVQPLVLPAGEYDAFTRTAKDKVSKSDNEMIELMLSVWDGQGNETMVFDYLLDAMPLKLRHFCIAAGIEEAYQAGELTAELCQEHNVRVKLKIDEGSGAWPRSNKVVDYLAPAAASPAEAGHRREPAPSLGPPQTQEQPVQVVADADNPF